MAIALDATISGTTATTALTCTGVNRLLFVSLSWSSGPNNSTAAPTYAGVAMTQISVNTANGTSAVVELWYLIAPTTGTNNIVVTVTSTFGLRVNAASYTGVAQTTPIDAITSSTPASFSSTTPAASTVTTTVDNDWLVSAITVAGSSATTELTVAAGTIRQNNAASTAVSGLADLTTTAAGSNAQTWTRTITSIRVAAVITVAFKDVASAVPAAHNLTLLGIGS